MRNSKYSLMNRLTLGVAHNYALTPVVRKITRDFADCETMIFERYNQRTQASNKGNNLLDFMAAMNEKLSEEEKWKPRDIIGNIANFMSASADSMDMMCTSAEFFARDPALQDQIRQVFKDHMTPEGAVDPSAILRSSALDSIYNEMLRIFGPAAFLTPRFLTRDMKLGKYRLKKGTQVTLPTGLKLRSPDLFKEPESFKSGRFLLENLSEIKDNLDHLPFSSGNRACPGRYLAKSFDSTILSIFYSLFETKLNGPPGKRVYGISYGIDRCVIKFRPTTIK